MITWIRERWVPLLAALATLAIGGLIWFLLQDARQSGVDSLRNSLLAEVSATARSQDQRVTSSLGAGEGLAQQQWDFELDSPADSDRLDPLLDLLPPDFRTGFFLTDVSGTITQGANLADRSVIGTRYDRPGFDELITSPRFLAGLGGYLPVADGLTADVPALAAVYPILDQGPVPQLRGTFVVETEVAADSSFNEEIGQLGHGDTGEYLFYDTDGRIIAASDPDLIATMVEDERLLTAPAGLDVDDGMIVVIQDVPSAGWRVAFRQDQEEFESGLVGPIQSIGQIVALFSVLLGAGLFVTLAHRLRAARDEQERLRALAASQEEFTSIVSHELRTPVAGVLGFLQTTIDHWDEMSDTARFDAVTRSASNARRLQALARDVLDSEAAESGRMTYVMASGDLVHEVEAAVEAARLAHPHHDLVVTRHASTAPVDIDADRIQQVMTNLLDNAARLSPPTAPIEIGVDREGDDYVVTVTDHGPGIDDASVGIIFDRFQRAKEGAVSGTGLGLYIARRIVEAHGGTISVDTAPGAGATFRFVLPAAD